MGGVTRRLARIEERHAAGSSAGARPRKRSAAERRERWLRRQRDARRERTPKCVFHARSYLAWLRLVGKLSDFASAAELIERIMEAPDASGYRQPPETRSHTAVAREVYVSIRRGDEGLAHLSIPPEWEVALVASEKLRERYLAMPAEHVASWWLEVGELQERGTERAVLEEHAARYEEPYGITAELLRTALGPDGAVLTDEERGWMLRAAMDDDRVAEAAALKQRWQISQAVRQMEAQQAKSIS